MIVYQHKLKFYIFLSILSTFVITAYTKVRANHIVDISTKTIQGLDDFEKANLFSLYNRYGITYNSQNNTLLYGDTNVRYFYDEFNNCGFINYVDGHVDLNITRNDKNEIVDISPIEGNSYSKRTDEINQNLKPRIENIKNILNVDKIDSSYPFIQALIKKPTNYIELDAENNSIIEQTEIKVYAVLYDDDKLQYFLTLDKAIEFYTQSDSTMIFEDLKAKKIWYKIPSYICIDNNLAKVSNSIESLIVTNKEIDNSTIYRDNSIVWANDIDYKENVLLDVPLITQLPELSKGCEVTSLAMLLNYAGYDVDKMTLADEIDKDYTDYYVENGIAYYGDPSKGFIGDMYGNDRGYGSDHVPIYKLLKNYMDTAVDITSTNFDSLYYYLNINSPVWVLINTDLKKLNENQFYSWQTPDGKTVKATNKEHAVLVVGYDEKYIYINDPLYSKVRKKVDKQNFIEAWEQMGNQAVTYVN